VTPAPGDPAEPELRLIGIFHIRRADSDVRDLVDQIVRLLDEEAALIDLSRHDSRGTTIHLRTR
jgi:hypothetical protein